MKTYKKENLKTREDRDALLHDLNALIPEGVKNSRATITYHRNLSIVPKQFHDFEGFRLSFVDLDWITLGEGEELPLDAYELSLADSGRWPLKRKLCSLRKLHELTIDEKNRTVRIHEAYMGSESIYTVEVSPGKEDLVFNDCDFTSHERLLAIAEGLRTALPGENEGFVSVDGGIPEHFNHIGVFVNGFTEIVEPGRAKPLAKGKPFIAFYNGKDGRFAATAVRDPHGLSPVVKAVLHKANNSFAVYYLVNGNIEKTVYEISEA